MKQSRIAVLVSVAALLAAGCTHVTPYPDSLGVRQADGGYQWACAQAKTNPGSSAQVMACLLDRGRGWEDRGRRIRGLSSGLGQALIPATAAGVGLLAAGDTSDAVPVLGLVTGSALTHSSAYARADLARIYEEAAGTYDCLTTAVAAWNTSSSTLNGAATRVEDRFKTVETLFQAQMALATREQHVVLAAALETLRIRAESVPEILNALEGRNGLALLDRSEAIEAAVRRVVADRLTDPQAVHAAASSQITAPEPAVDQLSAPVSFTATSAPPGIVENKRNEWDTNATALAAAVAQFGVALTAFRTAVDAHEASDLARTRAAACIFNPAEYALPALAATPSEIDLDGDSGTFVIRGGVAPFGLLPPPSGLRAVITPLNSTSALVTVTATTSGSWTLTVIDASTAGATATVTVRKAAAPPPEG